MVTWESQVLLTDGQSVNIFLISPRKHGCGYTLEVPHGDTSNEYL